MDLNDFLLPYLVLDLNKYKTISIAIQYMKGSYGRVDMGAIMAALILAVIPVVVFYPGLPEAYYQRCGSRRGEGIKNMSEFQAVCYGLPVLCILRDTAGKRNIRIRLHSVLY